MSLRVVVLHLFLGCCGSSVIVSRNQTLCIIPSLVSSFLYKYTHIHIYEVAGFYIAIDEPCTIPY